MYVLLILKLKRNFLLLYVFKCGLMFAMLSKTVPRIKVIDRNTDDSSAEEQLVRLLKFGTIKKIRDFTIGNPRINLHYPTQKLATPLTIAIGRGDLQILANLLDRVSTNLDDTTTQPCGKTALMHASYNTRNTEILQILLKKGADPQKTDIRGWNSLYYAVVGERIKNVIFILDAGVPTDSRDLDGRTPLMIAVILSNLEIMSVLLDREADVLAKDSLGCTALQLAILRKKRDAALTLIEKGSDVNHVCSASKYSLYQLAEKKMPDLLPVMRYRQECAKDAQVLSYIYVTLKHRGFDDSRFSQPEILSFFKTDVNQLQGRYKKTQSQSME